MLKEKHLFQEVVSQQKLTTRKVYKSLPLYLLLFPSFILLLFFSYLPLGGLMMAFQDFAPGLGLDGSPWVGLKNFKQFFQSYQFWLTIKNTIMLSFYGILVGFPLPILLAVLCSQMKAKRFKKIFQVTTYLPHFISTMVMCGMIRLFLSPSTGVIGHLLAAIGIEMPNILANPKAFSSIYVWTDVWQNIGWDSIIYLAAIAGIDPTYYEAAKIDGASRWQKIRYIDLPLLMPTAMVLLILKSGNILSVGFEKVYLLQNAMNLTGSEIISTYMYKMGIVNQQYSLSTAIGLFNTIVNVAVLLFVNRLSKKTTGNGLI